MAAIFQQIERVCCETCGVYYDATVVSPTEVTPCPNGHAQREFRQPNR